MRGCRLRQRQRPRPRSGRKGAAAYGDDDYDADSDHGRPTCRAAQQAFLLFLDSTEVTFSFAAGGVATASRSGRLRALRAPDREATSRGSRGSRWRPLVGGAGGEKTPCFRPAFPRLILTPFSTVFCPLLLLDEQGNRLPEAAGGLRVGHPHNQRLLLTGGETAGDLHEHRLVPRLCDIYGIVPGR